MKRRISVLLSLMLVAGLLVGMPVTASAHDPNGDEAQALKGRLAIQHPVDISPGGVHLEPLSNIRCEDGMADIFPCHKVDLASFTPLPATGSTLLNDVWGWEDSETGMQVAIVGSIDGTVFMDVTDGYNPVYLGTLESAVPGDFFNLWGDIRVYENTAYIGSEAVDFGTFGGAGVQIVDMTQFRGATGPIDIEEANRITDMTNSHNLTLNTDSGRLYVVGSYIGLSECAVDTGDPVFNGTGGALIYDVASDPFDPTFLGCMIEDGYTHDMQCVIYHGPDPDYQGSEICLGSNEDTLTIYDATDAKAPVVLSRLVYLDVPFCCNEETGIPNYYTHQGWLSEDHSFFFLGDELDEYSLGNEELSTYIWDMTDLDDAQLIGVHMDGNTAIDHNIFVHEGLLYQSNYTSGLWIYDGWKADQGRLKDRGFFDVFPANDDPIFAGTWGNYPYFGDGKVIVTSSDEGIFVLQSRAKSSNNDFAKGKSKR